MKAEADFASPEELAALLDHIGLKLHAKNRIAGGLSSRTARASRAGPS